MRAGEATAKSVPNGAARHKPLRHRADRQRVAAQEISTGFLKIIFYAIRLNRKQD